MTELHSIGKSDFVAQELLQQIEENILVGKIPGERDLATTYQVNIKTANKAVAKLVEDGYLERLKGKGTFVIKTRHALQRAGVMLRTEGHVFDAIYKKLCRLLENQNYIILMLNSPECPDEIFLREIISMDLDVLFVGRFESAILNATNYHDFAKKIIYVDPVDLEGTASFKDISQVNVDHVKGGYLATKHLLELGHSKVTHVSINDENSKKYSGTQLGYLNAMKEANLGKSAENVYFKNEMSESWPNLEACILRKEPPTAFVVNQDFAAIKCVQLIQKHGFNVPKDFSLVSYYNTPWSKDSYPTLSSISVNEEDLASELVRLALKKTKSIEVTTIKPKLFIRDSSQKI